MNNVAQGRSNVAPTKIPWDLIRRLITETYCGKVDNEDDFTALSLLVEKVMTLNAFESEHVLVEGDVSEEKGNSKEGSGELRVPSGTGMGDFMVWISQLPEREPPAYLGLPADAERLLLVGHGKTTIGNVVKITQILEEGEQVTSEAREGDRV